MDPSCSHSKCDVYEGTNKGLFESNAENKTDNDASMDDKQACTQQNVRQQIDDLERQDFEEENRILNRCSQMIVDGKIAATAHYSGNMSSANSSLASSSETISAMSNIIPNEFSMPGCSKSDDCEDSNTTIKNMIHSRKYLDDTLRKDVTFKPDFMQKLLSSGIPEKKDIPRGKMYKGDVLESSENDASETCDLEGVGGPSGRTSSNASSIASSSSDSTKEFNVPSTSNAEKLLGLDDGSRKNLPSSSKTSVIYSHFQSRC